MPPHPHPGASFWVRLPPFGALPPAAGLLLVSSSELPAMASDTPWLNSGSFVKFLRLEGAAPRSQLSERQLWHRGCCGLLSRDKTLERLWRWKGDKGRSEFPCLIKVRERGMNDAEGRVGRRLMQRRKPSGGGGAVRCRARQVPSAGSGRDGPGVLFLSCLWCCDTTPCGSANR